MAMGRNEALKTLRFQPNTNPSDEEIKKAYRKIALETHPDKTEYPPNATEVEKIKIYGEREENFKRVNEAHQLLTNKEATPSHSEKVPYEFMSPYQLFCEFYEKDPHFRKEFERDWFFRADFIDYKLNANLTGYYVWRPYAREYFLKNLDRLQPKKYQFSYTLYYENREHQNFNVRTDDEAEASKECVYMYSYQYMYSLLPVEIVITSWNVTPQFSGSVVVNALNKSVKFTKLQATPGFFDDEQQRRVNKLMQENKNYISQSNKYKYKWVLLIFCLAAIYPYMAGITLTSTIALACLGAIITNILIGQYNTYRENHHYRYRDFPKTNDLSASEIRALQAGLIADKDWSSYLGTFTLFDTYRNKVAYDVARKYVKEGNEEMLDTIKKFKI